MDAGQQDLPWMALPLFRRDASPELMCDVLTTKPNNCSYEEHLLANSANWLLTPEDDMADAQYGYFDLPEVPPNSQDFMLMTPSLETPDKQLLDPNHIDWKLVHDFDQQQHQAQLDFKLSDPDNGYYFSEEMLQDIEAATSSTTSSSPSPGVMTTVTCPYPGCKSTAVFNKVDDLRQHYQTHCKRFFCRYPDCPQSALNTDPNTNGKKGFATRKDRTRHEAKHKPEIRCQWQGENGEQCSRIFSRVDNMRDHVKRIHIRRGMARCDVNQQENKGK